MRGVKFPRVTQREERLKPETPQRDGEAVAQRKKVLEKKAARPEKVAKRERRKAVKAARSASEREKTFRNLRGLGLIH